MAYTDPVGLSMIAPELPTVPVQPALMQTVAFMPVIVPALIDAPMTTVIAPSIPIESIPVRTAGQQQLITFAPVYRERTGSAIIRTPREFPPIFPVRS